MISFSPHNRIALWLPLALTVPYLLMVLGMVQLMGPAVGIPSMLWAPAGAYLFRLRGGLILGTGAIIANEIAFHLPWYQVPDYTVPRDVIGSAAMVLMTLIAGGLRALVDRQRRLEAAVQSTHEGIAVTDVDLGGAGLRLQFANASFLKGSDQRLGSPALTRYAGQIDAGWLRELRAALSQRQPFVRQLTLPATPGQGERVVELSIDPVRDRAGRPTQLVLVQRDVTAYKQLEGQLAHQARHDKLTGLPNRAAFEDHLQRAAHQGTGESFAVLLLDLDGFKLVNDTLGHETGDGLLVQVGQRLRHALRPGDLVARLGGDEFVVVTAPLRGELAAQQVSSRILNAFETPFEVGGQVLPVRTSIGVSLWPADGQDAASLLKHADVAMYSAKQGGKQGVRFFTPAMSAAAEERVQLEGRLRHALQHGAFSLHYQPIVASGGGVPVAFEALLRWTDPELGPVGPDRFIPVAEDSGLIVPLGAWVLDEACRQLRAWHDAGHSGLRMSVNVSPLQFERPEFVSQVRAALARHRLKSSSLMLELTERLIVRDLTAAQLKMQTLRELGVELWIDDFGAGQAALSYLLRLPVSGVKVDRVFVQGLGDVGTRRIVQAIMALAGALQLGTVAEGVETPEQLESLQELGCDRMQGYLLGRPVPPEVAEQQLAQTAGAVASR
ncbi:putative bifunctional diguanylate cyclase/phosphodiesterase [Deinococcus sp.]|uniref:putative bifunctional diguanylate cyclase/phosphodiesterase n=1 Tax=Deinococcus sp. TaxID=47478 RepID=UPI003C7BCBA8